MRTSAIFIVLIGMLSCKDSGAEYPKKKGEITWISVETAESLANTDQKMYFFDMYTDWCGWCKVMDKKTFTDPEVIKLMDEKFHMVKFNAEQRQSVTFDGKTYDWQASGRNGINMLAYELLEGRLSYPSYVFLDANKKPVKIAMGFMPPEQFLSEVSNVLSNVQ